MIDKIKSALTNFITNNDEEEEDKKIILFDSSILKEKDDAEEPELNMIGLFADVVEEKIADLVHAFLYLNEVNKLKEKEEDKKPIKFYLSTYGGSADDMFALYDTMRIIREDTEIHTIGLGKVMSAGVLLLAADL